MKPVPGGKGHFANKSLSLRNRPLALTSRSFVKTIALCHASPPPAFPNLGEIGLFQACRQGSPRVSKVQGPWTLARGTPGMGEMSYNQIDHIKVIFLHYIQNRAISQLKFP